MRDKKAAPRVGALQSGRSITAEKTIAELASKGKVAFYPGGVLLRSPRFGNTNPTGKGRRLRGAVVGWSSASRRRLRVALLTLQPSEPVPCLGGSFTIPGPVLEPAEGKKLWADFCHTVQKAGWAFIWRLEIQARGALHWHVIAYPPLSYRSERLHGMEIFPGRSSDYTAEAGYQLCEFWFSSLDALGPRTFSPPYRGGKGEWKKPITSVESLSALPGADRHAAVVQAGGQQGAWLRYLQDHASKTKQEQIAVGIGRHWGIVGRSRLVESDPAGIDDLTRSEWFRFLRAFQRLCTPSYPAEGVPFGRRLGWRIRRGGIGSSVWFSRPDTVKRLVEWAHGGAVVGLPSDRGESVHHAYRPDGHAPVVRAQSKRSNDQPPEAGE